MEVGNNEIVVHHNHLNESIFNFNELELNLFIVIIYKLRQRMQGKIVDETKNGEIVIKGLDENKVESLFFSSKEIKNLMQMKDRSFKAFETVVKALQDRSISIKTQQGYRRIKAFTSIDFDEKKENILIDVNGKIVPLFYELTSQFTQYSLKEFLSLSSKHSKRLYQLLKQYESIGERTIRVEDLRSMLEVEKKYNKFANFESRVLVSSKNDINQKTTLEVDYKKEKVGKEIKEITFSIKKKELSLEEPTVKKETREEIIKRCLNTYGVKYIKDLNIVHKKFLDVALIGAGYKPTAEKKNTKGGAK